MMAMGLADITAVILAGGLGTRLQSVVEDRSKVMAEVAGRPFLTYLLDQVEATGIRCVVICTGHHGAHLEEVLGSQYGTMQLVYSREESPLGTGGALRQALPLVPSDPMLVMNGDSYCSMNLCELFAAHQQRGAVGTIALCEMADSGSYGTVTLDADGRIAAFREKDAVAGPGWINAGVYVVTRELVKSMPADRAVSLERETFPTWAGHGLYGHASDCELMDIGTPDRYELAQTFFVSLESPEKKGSVA